MPDMQRPTLGSASFGLVMGTLAGAALLLLAAPTLVVLVTSFTDGYSLKFPPPSYSLRWYASLIDAWQLQDAALVSLKLGAVVTAVSVALGTAAALAIGRSRRAWARGLDALFMSPLVLPALAFGLASLVFFSTAGVELSFLTLAIGHIVQRVPSRPPPTRPGHPPQHPARVVPPPHPTAAVFTYLLLAP
ncbi:ABC transporter permease, partial [Azospirillum brasilense]|uniref:ABC transporter permease n=1 Tax=Azospirillum brasilense TaxID=192 RepID=UPI003CE4CC8D